MLYPNFSELIIFGNSSFDTMSVWEFSSPYSIKFGFKTKAVDIAVVSPDPPCTLTVTLTASIFTSTDCLASSLFPSRDLGWAECSPRLLCWDMMDGCLVWALLLTELWWLFREPGTSTPLVWSPNATLEFWFKVALGSLKLPESDLFFLGSSYYYWAYIITWY